MNHKIELISFKLCPFVHRSLILLNEKGADYKITYIDLANKPEWFLKISPLGKVPLLKVNGEVLFESSVINEFLDELISPSLHPTDILIKAKQRAWVEFSSTLVFDMINWVKTSNADDFNKAKQVFESKLHMIEQELQGAFFGECFQLVDIAFAPILVRLSFIENNTPAVLDGFPKIKKWMESVLVRASVDKSFDQKLENLFINRFKQQGSLLLGSDKKD